MELEEGQTQVDEGQADDTQYENDAREMGWVSKDEWEGPEDKWVDARTFVEKGENILPLLRANNKRLKKDLQSRDREIGSLRESVEAANKAIKALQKHHTEATAQAVEKAKTDLKAQLREAREIGDLDAEEQIQDKLHELRNPKTAVVEDEPPKEPALHPEFIAWRDAHPDLFDESTVSARRRMRDFQQIGKDLREDGDLTVGKAFMDKCLAILEKREGKAQNKPMSKVEGGSSGVRSSGSRSFDSLPKEARDACHDDNDSFVGPGKMFKTVKEWEDHFTRLYNED